MLVVWCIDEITDTQWHRWHYAFENDHKALMFLDDNSNFAGHFMGEIPEGVEPFEYWPALDNVL